MKLHLNNPDPSYQITGFKREANSFKVKIGDTFYGQSLILTSDNIEVWHADNVSALSQSHFDHLACLDVELIVLGTGLSCVFPAPALTQPLMKKGIGLESMDTAAACRTYNILSGDGRSVAAALIL